MYPVYTPVEPKVDMRALGPAALFLIVP